MGKKSPFSALEISTYIIQHHLENNQTITHIRLQKLLYFLSVAWIKQYGYRLFFEPIEKWKLGPVVHDVYQEYRMVGVKPIKAPLAVFTMKVEGTFDRRILEPPSWIHSHEKLILSVLEDTKLSDDSQLIDRTQEHVAWCKDARRINNGEKGICYTDDELMNET